MTTASICAHLLALAFSAATLCFPATSGPRAAKGPGVFILEINFILSIKSVRIHIIGRVDIDIEVFKVHVKVFNFGVVFRVGGGGNSPDGHNVVNRGTRNGHMV